MWPSPDQSQAAIDAKAHLDGTMAMNGALMAARNLVIPAGIQLASTEASNAGLASRSQSGKASVTVS